MKEKNKKTIFWIIIIIAILLIINYFGNRNEKWKEENCELTFNTYNYNDGSASACSIKCSDEGFPHTDAGVLEPYLSAEEMANSELDKRCECNCGGCRER